MTASSSPITESAKTWISSLPSHRSFTFSANVSMSLDMTLSLGIECANLSVIFFPLCCSAPAAFTSLPLVLFWPLPPQPDIMPAANAVTAANTITFLIFIIWFPSFFFICNGPVLFRIPAYRTFPTAENRFAIGRCLIPLSSHTVSAGIAQTCLDG